MSETDPPPLDKFICPPLPTIVRPDELFTSTLTHFMRSEAGNNWLIDGGSRLSAVIDKFKQGALTPMDALVQINGLKNPNFISRSVNQWMSTMTRLAEHTVPDGFTYRDTHLTPSEIQGLLAGNGHINFEENEETMRTHIISDYALMDALGTSFWEIGSILGELSTSVRHDHETYARRSLSEDEIFHKIKFNGLTFRVRAKGYREYFGIPIKPLDPSPLDVQLAQELEDVIVRDENDNQMGFARSCQTACRYRSYLEPQSATGALFYRIDPGVVLDFVKVLPSGKSWDDITEVRTKSYLQDINSTNFNTRKYGREKLWGMTGPIAEELIRHNMPQLSLETTDDSDEIIELLQSLKWLRDGLKVNISTTSTESFDALLKKAIEAGIGERFTLKRV